MKRGLLIIAMFMAGLIVAESNCSASDGGRLAFVGGQPVSQPLVRVGPLGRVARNREAIRANRGLAAFRAQPFVVRQLQPVQAFTVPTFSRLRVVPSNGGRILIINSR